MRAKKLEAPTVLHRWKGHIHVLQLSMALHEMEKSEAHVLQSTSGIKIKAMDLITLLESQL